jgi:diguanylate cyclase (GGDEF)-like protein
MVQIVRRCVYFYTQPQVTASATHKPRPVGEVDDLHAVDDRDGIAAGNEMLKNTAKVLKAFRAEDVVARIDGDKFAALLPLADRGTGENVIKRLKKVLEAHNKNFQKAPSKLSFGIATGEKGCSLSDVLKKAEAAMN